MMKPFYMLVDTPPNYSDEFRDNFFSLKLLSITFFSDEETSIVNSLS